jgi:guanylate kinase
MGRSSYSPVLPASAKGRCTLPSTTSTPERAANLQKLVLFNCRSPRPGESDGKDYYFRSREEIDGFREKKNLVVLDVRGDLQAIDLNDVERALSAGDLFFEGNPVVGRGFYNRRNC